MACNIFKTIILIQCIQQTCSVSSKTYFPYFFSYLYNIYISALPYKEHERVSICTLICVLGRSKSSRFGQLYIVTRPLALRREVYGWCLLEHRIASVRVPLEKTKLLARLSWELNGSGSVARAISLCRGERYSLKLVA